MIFSKSIKKTNKWHSDILEKYNEDLDLSQRIVENLISSNYCKKPEFISITQPVIINC